MSENIIEKTIKETIKDRNTYFVFPTEIDASLWADRTTLISSCTAVAMERFMAWDKFKGEAVRSENQDKDSVPAIMRMIFAANVIEENSSSPFLRNLINPEFASKAGGFETWISSLLPALGLWKEYFDKNNDTADDEDKDFLELYERYSTFLNKYNLFDPAWEKPPFKNTGKKYIIFFPQINEDWEEYKRILENSKEYIKIINLEKKDEQEGIVNFFSNSRIEIKNAATYIQKIKKEKGYEWTDFAVNVPDLEVYGPYLEKELTMLEIPYVTKYARPLNSNGAGNLFNQIKNCIESGNSYETIKDLLLNTQLPWKDVPLIKKLIEYGKQNHCICSFKKNNYQIDIWKESFKVKFVEKEVKDFYDKLNFCMKNLTEAKSFEHLRKAYFEFREKMFDMSSCSEKTNNVLSRCISELGGIIDIERKYSECKVSSPLSFFTDYLGKIKYLEQTKENGVAIFPYKTAACAPFACHIVIDSSQSSLSVIYKDLSFLNEEKRIKLLHRTETNVSDKFIQLYLLNSITEPAYFTCAKRTLGEYAQASSYLKENDLTKETDEDILFSGNFYNNEKEWFIGDSKKFPEEIFEYQKNSLNTWLEIQVNENENQEKAENFLKKDEKIRVSATSLKKFYTCPRLWYLSEKLNLREVDNAAELMNKYASGNLYHKILEIFLDSLKEKNLELKIEEEELPASYKEILDFALDKAIEYKDKDFCYIKSELLETSKQTIKETINKFVIYFSTIMNNCRVIEVEGEYLYSNIKENFEYVGKIDCLLQDKVSNQYYLIDFKNTNNAIPKNLYVQDDTENDRKKEELPDFQISSYVYLLRNQKNPVEVKNAAFFDINGCTCTPVFGSDMDRRSPASARSKREVPNIEGYESTIDKTLECVDNYVERIKDHNYEIDPKVQNYSICSACRLKSICRKTFNVAKDN